ncbi:MAG: hypothetical protein GXP49_16530 [Deltaproteobacteria bacterium]|nr:hypothetical protein [Deltaproteobacteria bacterium]
MKCLKVAVLIVVMIFGWWTSGCGKEVKCVKSGTACTNDELPNLPDKEANASISGLAGGDSFHAYGENNSFWNSDGKGVSIFLRDPFFTKEQPRPLTIRLDLFRDEDNDSPACFVRDKSFPLCFTVGEDGGGTASLEEQGDSYNKIYVTEAGANGSVELLGFNPDGMLSGKFEFTGYLKSGGFADPESSVQVTAGNFAVAEKR